jgi:transcriptional regulator with XRE-family HTH domain
MRFLVARLREERRRLGLSMEEQARRLGVAKGTLRALEDGGDLRLATLAQLLAAFPDVPPSQALGRGEGRVPPLLSAFHDADARLGEARKLTREVRRSGDGSSRISVSYEGVRAPGLESGSRGSLAGLVRTLLPHGLRSAPAVAAAASRLNRGDSARIEDGEEEILLGLDEAGLLDVRATRALPPRPGAVSSPAAAVEAGWALVPALPCRLAELSVWDDALAEGGTGLAWPTALVLQGPEDDVLPALHPGRPGTSMTTRGSRARLRVELAGPGVTMALVPGSSQAAARGEDGAHRWAREMSGRSLREAGAEAGLSAMAISKAERGGDLKVSSAQALLSALPRLSPWSLVAGSLDPTPALRWSHAADLAGCIADEEWKVVTLLDDGSARIEIGTRGLRRLRGSGELRVRLGLDHPGLLRSRARLSEVRAGAAGPATSVRITTIGGPDGERQQQLAIPAALARDGASHSRVLQHPVVYTMTRARAVARDPSLAATPLHEGTSFVPLVPCMSLGLEVRWPRGWHPAEVRAHAWPIWMPPDPEAREALAGDAPPPELEVSPARRRMRLVVQRPLPGVKYALSWALP